MDQQRPKSLARNKQTRVTNRARRDGSQLAGCEWYTPLVNDQEGDVMKEQTVELAKGDTLCIILEDFPSQKSVISYAELLERQLVRMLREVRQQLCQSSAMEQSQQVNRGLGSEY